MYYVLVDGEGNRLDAFQDEQAAHDALREMVAEDPAMGDDVLLFRYRDDGGREGPALMFADLDEADAPVVSGDAPPHGGRVSGNPMRHDVFVTFAEMATRSVVVDLGRSAMLMGVPSGTVRPTHPRVVGGKTLHLNDRSAARSRERSVA